MVLPDALTILGELTKRSIHSFAGAKELLTNSFNRSFESQLESERAVLVDCTNHADGQEGLKAFSEKREPVFDT